jgi:hypothetical protein
MPSDGNMILFDKFEIMYKEAVMAYFKALSWHLIEGIENIHENYSQVRKYRGRDSNTGTPEYEYETGVLTTACLVSTN